MEVSNFGSGNCKVYISLKQVSKMMRRIKKKGVLAKKNIPLSQFPPLGCQGPAMDADLNQNLKDLWT